ncbi:hypothetical protein [Rhizobium sp. HT1-10]|uniref:hypothetical protein n=1 Tax=Rhizobium sp. HT1-10 TaxID=3111638 RepID=UPI003C1B1031
MSNNSTPAAADVETCPICAVPFKPEDICATDITEGTCHATCLEGSAVVDIDTGDEMPTGKIATYPYSDVMDPSTSAPRRCLMGRSNLWSIFTAMIRRAPCMASSTRPRSETMNRA